MQRSLEAIINRYDRGALLAHAATPPADWYVDPRVADLERRTTFSRAWQCAARLDQLRRPGQYVSCELPAGEPVAIVRGSDDVLRGFYNVCRHHAAAVVTEPEGSAHHLRCPYHGWTYSLEGELKGTPDFAGVCDFDRASNGLVPIETAVWEKWVFVKLEPAGPPQGRAAEPALSGRGAQRPDLSLDDFIGSDLSMQFRLLALEELHWMETRRYTLDCNWKVYVDNYLDGGYHVPSLHKGLNSVLDYREYTIENGERFSLQWSPIVSEGADRRTGEVRRGARARYYWIYPNFMINCYAGAMDTNLVIPRGVDKTEVVFDFYFTDISDRGREQNLASIAVSHQIQEEDEAICRSVQRGLGSRAYGTGRLSVRREAGEHLFHRLLHADLVAGLPD